ncbi:MAG: tetratricopeptide repeat protein [Actinomycetota bacterium]|nr:tetratricopeptide repeat protein [Actinomycetota bacterium]
MSEHLDAIARVIRSAAGLRLEQSRHHALRAALARAWPGVPHAEVLRRALDPVTGPETVATLINEVTIKETSFLRDRRQLGSIDWHDLHAHAREAGSGVVRVWSVACATGEEPYSLALLACEAFAPRTPPVRILATDVSSAALAFATAGRYRERSAQGLEEPLRSRYLERVGDQLVVVPALRALVELAPHNLVSDAYPPAGEAPFQLILCRNVLIYFDSETCARVVAGLERALAPGGRLALGAADALCVLDRAVGELHRRPPKAKPSVPPAERRQRTLAPAVLEARPPSRTDEDIMNPEVHYLHGLAELESGDAAAAVSSLRRVLYLDPGFELAAFALGRAHEKAGELDAARRRYEQALRMLGVRPAPGERLAGPIDAATVIDACEARLLAIQGGRR